MATFRMLCPNDGVIVRVGAEHRGKPLRCPHCETLLVEAPAESSAPLPFANRSFWSDLLLFTGLGLLVVVALVYWGLRWGFGIDLLPLP